jgi:hypothetical protein
LDYNIEEPVLILLEICFQGCFPVFARSIAGYVTGKNGEIDREKTQNRSIKFL